FDWRGVVLQRVEHRERIFVCGRQVQLLCTTQCLVAGKRGCATSDACKDGDRGLQSRRDRHRVTSLGTRRKRKRQIYRDVVRIVPRLVDEYKSKNRSVSVR